MNAIPLIKGNTPQEINTSIIALKKALGELEAKDRLLEGTDKDVQDKIKQINELIAGINTHLGTVDTHLGNIDTHLGTIEGQITALQPVDTVTSGNMHSVTSNAVASYANKIIKYKQVIIDSITIGSSGYVDIRDRVPSEMNNFMFALLWRWGDISSNSPIAVETDGLWLWGQAGSVCTEVTLRYYYTD